MTINKAIPLIALGLVSATVAGYVISKQDQPEVEGLLDLSKFDAQLRPYGFVDPKKLWPKNTVIPVCWDNPEAVTASKRELVRRAIADSWESAANIEFAPNWGACANPESPGIHIFWKDDPRGAGSLIGNRLDRSPRAKGMRLNPTFLNWRKACQSNVELCIQATATHEFGHAIGLNHESLRNDAPPSCKNNPDVLADTSQTTDTDTLGTPYDDKSIMNYCNKMVEDQTTLSEGDIKVAQIMYGPPLK